MEPDQLPTRYYTRPPERAFVAPLPVRAVRREFANTYFSYVDIVQRRFEGARYYGAKRFKWAGIPIACVSFPHPGHDDMEGRFSRPSLCVFQFPQDKFDCAALPELVKEIFSRIRVEYSAYEAIPDTGKFHRRILLFTLDDEMNLQTFLSPE